MRKLFVGGLLLVTLSNGCAFADGHAGGVQPARQTTPDIGILSVTPRGPAAATVVIQTIAVAVKETETKEQLARLGEVYAFSPTFFAVYRDQPTRIQLWNLQPDDPHNFTLRGPGHRVLMSTMLAPLAKKSLVFTFHREGLYTFSCSIHQPEMSGQILVLPPLHESAPSRHRRVR